jgi:hypothetical protein
VNAADVKAALRRRHPAGYPDGSEGPWTCIEEWRNIDLLAVSAWASCRPYPPHARVGYEVKVSRSDYRRELIRPRKRAVAVKVCHEFYFAVPAGLLTQPEIDWRPPPALSADPSPFQRAPCPGAYGAPCYEGTVRFGVVDRRESRTRAMHESWGRNGRWVGVDYSRVYRGSCPTCRGVGWIMEAGAVLADAPYVWVPDDVGLVIVGDHGATAVVRKAPRNFFPDPLTSGDKGVADLIRWVATRPDSRRVRTSHLPAPVGEPARPFVYPAGDA